MLTVWLHDVARHLAPLASFAPQRGMYGFGFESRPGHSKSAPLARAAVRSLQLRDVQLYHLQHRVADTLRARWVLVGHHLVHRRGDDLPAHAVLVLQPPARLGLAASEQCAPVPAYLGLVVTNDDHTDPRI